MLYEVPVKANKSEYGKALFVLYEPDNSSTENVTQTELDIRRTHLLKTKKSRFVSDRDFSPICRKND